MRAVYAFKANDFRQAVAVSNVLVSHGARIISVEPEAKKYEIWFEHECALEREWRMSIWLEAKSHPAMSDRG